MTTPVLVVAVLATWRLTHLLQAEDGPADVIVRLRRAAGDGVLGRVLDCFYCLSLWVAVPFALVTGTTWPERAMLALALSGGACLLERLEPSLTAARYIEDEEQTDALLRPKTSADLATPELCSDATAGDSSPALDISARPSEEAASQRGP